MTTLSEQGLAALRRRVQEEIDSGHMGAAQLAIGLDGEIVEFACFGSADEHSRFLIFSATKALVAMALVPHFADGAIDLTTPVAAYLPEFGENGKADVTVLQLLTMQGGFPLAPMGPRDWGTSAGRRAKMAAWRLDWKPGSRTEYHPIAAHWVVAELIEALSGRPYLQVVHERIAAPAGVPAVLGPDAAHSPAMTVRAMGERGNDEALLAAFGRPDLVPVPGYGPEMLLSMNEPSVQQVGIPGGGGIATAATMARIYQHLLHDPHGVFPREWRLDALGTVRNASISVGDGVPANRTIAGYVAGNDGFHRHRWMPATAPRAFGHPGAGGQLNWCDPDSGISFSFLHDSLHRCPGHEITRIADFHRLLMAAVQQ
jgi:CubicO group peptidase (beta-lactamase class C family)